MRIIFLTLKFKSSIWSLMKYRLMTVSFACAGWSENQQIFIGFELKAASKTN